MTARADGSVGVQLVDVEYVPNGNAAAALLRAGGEGSGSTPVGVVSFREFEAADGAVAVRVEVSLESGALPAGEHALQLHEGRSPSTPSFNPRRSAHGAPDAVTRGRGGKLEWGRHVGDLGNVQGGANEYASAVYDPLVTLRGRESVIGRCVCLHANADDFGADWLPGEALVSGVVQNVSERRP